MLCTVVEINNHFAERSQAMSVHNNIIMMLISHTLHLFQKKESHLLGESAALCMTVKSTFMIVATLVSYKIISILSGKCTECDRNQC